MRHLFKLPHDGFDINVNEPKIIIISNAKCMSFTEFTTYFLKTDGTIYFRGVLVEDNDQYIIKILPVKFGTEENFESLYFLIKYNDLESIVAAIKNGNIFRLENNNFVKTKYKTIFDYYTKEQKMTNKTVYMSQHIWAEEELVFIRKHFEIFNKLDSGAFGQVFKVQHNLDKQFYAIKSIKLPGNKFFSNVASDINSVTFYI